MQCSSASNGPCAHAACHAVACYEFGDILESPLSSPVPGYLSSMARAQTWTNRCFLGMVRQGWYRPLAA